MKNILLLFAFLLGLNCAFAYEYDVIVQNGFPSGQKIGYNMTTKEWSKSLKPGDVILTKRTTTGTGAYSEFEFRSEWLETGTTYEFLDVDKLIGYNAHSLKFFELSFNGKTISKTELSARDVQKYFPEVEIIKVSEFFDNQIEVTKPWFTKKTFMLVNDTDAEFYKYQFEKYKTPELFKGVFEAKKPQKFTFSHYGADNQDYPALKIKVKNTF